MKHHPKLHTFAAVALMAGAMTSCLNNDGPTTDKFIVNSSITPCYAVITDMESNSAQTISYPVTLQCQTNWTDEVLDLSISGIQIGASNLPVMSFTNLEIKQNKDGWLYNESTILESSKGQLVTTNTLTNFKLEYLDRYDLMETLRSYKPACAFEFVLDGRYQVAGATQSFFMGGSTEATPKGGSPFTTQGSLYTVDLDMKKNTANITIANAQFMAQMPVLTSIAFPDVPFTFGENGKTVILEKDALTPTFAGTPNADYPITDLKGVVKTDEGMELEFICTYKGLPFTVKANLKFSDYKAAL